MVGYIVRNKKDLHLAGQVPVEQVMGEKFKVELE